MLDVNREAKSEAPEESDVVAAAAEGREDPLFNWTRPPLDECPICMLPLPFDERELVYRSCCGKTICAGCMYDQVHAEHPSIKSYDECRARFCPFCRTESNNRGLSDEYDVRLAADMKLAKTGNHSATWRIGEYYCMGWCGLQQDKVEAIKWWRRAAEAGSAGAARALGVCYLKGNGMEQNNDRALEYFQKAAELGCVEAFSVIGNILLQKALAEAKKDLAEEGFLNYRKAAMCGVSAEVVFNMVREGYKLGFITKDEYAYTLRENQKATNEMKSKAREIVKIGVEMGIFVGGRKGFIL